MTKATSEMTNEEFSDYIASLFYISDNTGHEDTATIDELEEILGMYTTDPECKEITIIGGSDYGDKGTVILWQDFAKVNQQYVIDKIMEEG